MYYGTQIPITMFISIFFMFTKAVSRGGQLEEGRAMKFRMQLMLGPYMKGFCHI